MISEGLLSGLKNIAPNATATAQNNEIIIEIPKEDILNQIKNSMPENIRHLIQLEYTERGIVMKARLM